jgi:hypothetical protein
VTLTHWTTESCINPTFGEKEVEVMAPANKRSVSSVPTSAHALRLEKAAKALQEEQQLQDRLIWLALGAIVVSGTATGFFSLDKIINCFKGKRKKGENKSASEDEEISDDIIEDDALAEGVIGLTPRRKRNIIGIDHRELKKIAKDSRHCRLRSF